MDKERFIAQMQEGFRKALGQVADAVRIVLGVDEDFI
jgi:hypothetical protein